MTAPNPRLEEIEGRLSKVARIQAQGGKYADLDAAVYRSQSDVAYLLAELRKAQDKLARVEEQCAAADDMAAYVMGEDVQAALRMCARGIRAAVADATGGERGYE